MVQDREIQGKDTYGADAATLCRCVVDASHVSSILISALTFGFSFPTMVLGVSTKGASKREREIWVTIGDEADGHPSC
jgi:hypothetical protein